MHAACGESAVHATPQNGRDLVAVEAIENAASLGSVDEFRVDRPWVGNRLGDRRFGDFMEHHAVHVDLGVEVLAQVGRNRLALAVFVGCEIDDACVFQVGFQVLDDLPAALGQLVCGLEIVVDVDGETLAR